MKRLMTALLAATFAAALFAPTAALADGPAAFKVNKCNECHSVKVAGIAIKGTPEEEAPDLSKAGKTGDKKWIAKYVLKKVDNKEGEKHKKKCRGSKDDLKIIAEWLGGLK